MCATTANRPFNELAVSSGHGRKLLALEALSKLADQFARNPELQNLVDSFALTMSGQFAVASTYVITRESDIASQVPVSSATGRFRQCNGLCELDLVAQELPELIADPRPRRLDEPGFTVSEATSLIVWRHAGASLIAPLVLDNKLIGVMLLGQRVNHAPLNDEDLDLLQTLVATVTPLIANSFLYSEKAHLSARYRLILDSVRQAIFVFNAQGTLRLANQTAAELICTLVDSDFGGGPAGLPMETVFPDNVFPGWIERFQRAREDCETKPLSTMVATPKNGERIFNVRVGSLADLGEGDQETVITLLDVTEQNDNERRMFELEKFAEQGVMASSISHELNNHLGVILGGIELAAINLSRGNSEKVTQTLTKLRESVERMGRFTSGLMDFAHVNEVRQPVRINDVITDVLSFVMAQKRFSRIIVKTLLTPQIPTIEMNRDQIAQLIINLLNNAADAIAETGRTDGIIIVSTSANDQAVTLAISDNGRGMTPEVRDKLFKSHLTTKPKGHGYGLMTCAKILNSHHATVEINSRIGFGTTFEFRFGLPETPTTD